MVQESKNLHELKDRIVIEISATLETNGFDIPTGYISFKFQIWGKWGLWVRGRGRMEWGWFVSSLHQASVGTKEKRLMFRCSIAALIMPITHNVVGALDARRSNLNHRNVCVCVCCNMLLLEMNEWPLPVDAHWSILQWCSVWETSLMSPSDHLW